MAARGDFRTASYWLGTRRHEPRPPLSSPLDVDVAVIGGGFTGLATAWFLRAEEPSCRVALLEADVVGFGASGRNAGFSMTKIGMSHSVTALRFGRLRAVEAHRYADRAVDLLRRLVADLALDCDYEHPGFLWVATSTRHATRLYKEWALVASLGIEGIELLDPGAVAERVRSPRYVASAWWEPNCGLLNPAKLAWSWRDALLAAGVEVYESTPVRAVERRGGRSVLHTPSGTVHADAVVFATNAWSGAFGPLRRKQVPVWTSIVLTEPLDDDRLASIGWRGREGIEDFRNLVHYYRLTADNRIVFGGRDVGLPDRRGMDRPPDPLVHAKLRADLVATFPGLAGVRFTHAWDGPVSATLDLFPALGYAGGRDHVYALGCVGHGVSTSHLHGRTLADLVLGRDTDLTRTFFVNRRVVPVPPGPLAAPVLAAIAGSMRADDRRHDDLPG